MRRGQIQGHAESAICTLGPPQAKKETLKMTVTAPNTFDTEAFLTIAGFGRTIVEVRPKQPFFSQGDDADSVFYILKGRAKVTVVSRVGKEATITLLAARDFVGEEALARVPGRRLSSATAITNCTALKIQREEMIRAIHEEQNLSDRFWKFLLERNMRIQADLVDQLFNSSEKRLARVLLLMAEFGESGKSETLIPKISQETLAEMIGTTRSRVNFFMNRFRELGLIEYNGRICVHKSLLNVVLHDRMSHDDAIKPAASKLGRNRPGTSKINRIGQK
jgi:CRP/FNR family transcriptional regulator, cyclic AMP receptor protein